MWTRSIPQHRNHASPPVRGRLAIQQGDWQRGVAANRLLGLIQRWIEDPSNVRLLRIGLDLWPDVAILREILKLLRPFVFVKKGNRSHRAVKSVAWYCLSEILRAGAIETGLVEDGESLPSRVNLQSYRMELHKEATRLVKLPAKKIPWYLRQQALLFLAAFSSIKVPATGVQNSLETRHYRNLIWFLLGQNGRLDDAEFATLAVLARRAFVNQQRAIELTVPYLNPSRVQQIALRDPSFLVELIDANESLLNDLPNRIREDLSRIPWSPDEGMETLAGLVLRERLNGPLRNELSLLRFGVAFLKNLRKRQQRGSLPRVITPSQVHLKRLNHDGIADVKKVWIQKNQIDPSGSLYQPPKWCVDTERWRFQLGFLLRFILSGHPDFTRPVRPSHWKENESTYRPAENHWYQRLYGLFNGQPAFGDDWLPITNWMEQFLLALLRWPGCRIPKDFNWLKNGIDEVIRRISDRIEDLEKCLGKATGTLLLPMIARRPTKMQAKRPLRACVVQTAMPTTDNFQNKCDLELNDPKFRKEHRNHLSAALAAVKHMLVWRGTHVDTGGELDWLILPELAVHPSDVRTHLIPFARAHKTVILTGLTYERILTNRPLVNAALWIIPEWSEAYGLQIRTRRQGKKHLAPDEPTSNGSMPLLQGFRPCQWLVGYPWSNKYSTCRIWLTATVCYDATDLGLATDLRNQSDILAVLVDHLHWIDRLVGYDGCSRMSR